MHKYSHYPKKSQVWTRNHLVVQALQQLSVFNIHVIGVDMQAPEPILEVSHCPGIEHLKKSHAGVSHQQGEHYVKRESRLAGCRIIWSEAA